MRLSKLQKYILLICYEARNFTEAKAEFYKFYSEDEFKKNKNSIQIRVHNSIENMVRKDWAVAYGHKTIKKFYVSRVRLTNLGKQKAKELLQEKQSKLPIK